MPEPKMTVEEFDALLENYKEQNPEKYEEKEKSGFIATYRATLPGQPKKKKKEEKPKEEEKPKAKAEKKEK